MGFIFRKSFKVAPGVRLNVSKRGMGVSVGGKNTPRVSVNTSGQVTKSLRIAPGLRYQETSTLGSKRKRKAASNPEINNQSQATTQSNNETQNAVDNLIESDIQGRSLWLPHSIWSVLFFALAGFISATQESYDQVAFFIVAMGFVFLATYIWNLVSKD